MKMSGMFQSNEFVLKYIKNPAYFAIFYSIPRAKYVSVYGGVLLHKLPTPGNERIVDGVLDGKTDLYGSGILITESQY